MALTCTIDPDHARLWFRLARRVLGGHWDILIVGGCGTLPAEFYGCSVQRVVNVCHGRKLDFILRRVAADYAGTDHRHKRE